MTQQNIAVKSKRVYVTGLDYLSKYHGYRLPFKAMSDKDITHFLASLYKDRAADPRHGLDNNRNGEASTISKFYRLGGRRS